MAGFDEFKQKALDAAEMIADKSAELYRAAEGKTKKMARAAKLNTEIAKERSNLKKQYAELGSLYYNLFGEAPAEQLVQLCAEIAASLDYINVRQEELAVLRNDPDAEAQIVQENGEENDDEVGAFFEYDTEKPEDAFIDEENPVEDSASAEDEEKADDTENAP